MDARVNLSLPPDLMERLQRAAAREERPVPAFIRLLVRRGLDALEGVPPAHSGTLPSPGERKRER